ncbi:uncharacterized protein [Montipora foliosa]|uniref:uncharacterized protein n=1 Tax=Montipora foliosa TaxID=591990 RepID=UPI0035F10D0E
MESRDLLGDVGRQFVKACVRVRIYEKHKLAEFTNDEAVQRVVACLTEPLDKNDVARVLAQVGNKSNLRATFNMVDIYKAVKFYRKERRVGAEKFHAESARRRKDVRRELRLCLKSRGERKASTVGSSQESNQHQRCEVKSYKEKARSDAEERWQLLGATASIPEGVDDGERNAVVLHSKNSPVEQNEWDSSDDEIDERLASLDEEGISDDEIDYGSGFIIDTLDLGFETCDVYIITCKHVIQEALGDKSKEVRISNRVINELPCEIVEHDPLTDLAVLCCRDQEGSLSGIPRLQFSEEEPKTGEEVFSFGYPLTHPGKEALFVRGCVAGIQERFGKPDVKVLDCPVSHGCSGSPVLRWINGEMKVVGVILQKHKKDILTLKDQIKIEEIRASLGAASISDAQNHLTATHLLVLKLTDALETHTQFNNCNAMTGNFVKNFCINVINPLTP